VLLNGHVARKIFVDDVDRESVISLLKDTAPANDVLLHAYGLGNAEIRLLLTPQRADGLSRMMQIVARGYGAYFNRRHGGSGTLWDGRFKATIIDPDLHLIDSMVFVELNEDLPNGLVAVPTWSSASHHLGLRLDQFLNPHVRYWALGNTPFEREAAYRRYVEKGLSQKRLEDLRQAVLKSWPLGSAMFIESLSAATSRRLGPLKRGRPIKIQSDPN
jgi:putative transposase